MNTQILLNQYFETAFSAPDGIKRLRELILSLAMQGKLVPQDPNDQPARELLQEIEAEKQRLIKAGKIKKQKPLPPIQPEEIPYDLPESWEWVRLGDISIKIHYGYTASANHNLTDIRLLRITDIQDNQVNWNSVPGCDIKEKDIDQYLLEDNDILIARTGGTVGKTYLVQNIKFKSVFASYLIRIVPSGNLFVNCLKLFLESPLYWQQLYEKCSGTGQPNVNGTSLATLNLPLPPLAEQKRIVEKIESLMAQCDELEKRQQEREQKRILVHTSAIQKLLNAPEEKTFGDAWQFIKQNFGELYAIKENVSELRKAILQLAVMGKLVPQDPNDTPASELLKEITAEKQRLIKEGKIKKQKPLPEITANEIPHDLPNGWQMIRLGTITNIVRGGSPRPAKDPRFYDGNIPFLKVADLTANADMYLENYTYTIKEAGLIKTRMVPPLTLMLTNSGATLGIPKICKFQTTFNDGIAAFIFMNKNLYKPFFYYLLKSKTKWFLEVASRGQGQPNLNTDIIGDTVIGLPPLSEQHRIVAKVDALMALCDQLENQIDQQTAKQTQLLEAVMAGV